MKTSTSQHHQPRSIRATLGAVAAALAFGGILCAMPLSSVSAAPYHDQHHDDHRGHVEHRDYNTNHWNRGNWGGTYYAPGPDYYVAPEPYAYAEPAPCYGPYYETNCGPPPTSGVNLFFGL